jgi:hypothetical protein
MSDLNLDNQFTEELDDDLELEELDEQETDEQDEPEPEPKRGGDRTVALRQERERRRELESEIASMRAQQQQERLLLQSLSQRGYGQQQQQPQLTPEEYNERLLEQLTENPSQVFNNYATQLQQQLRQQFAPAVRETALNRVFKSNPEYKEVYEMYPEVIDGWLESESTNGVISEEAIHNALGYFHGKEQGRASKAQPKAIAKDRATSVASKKTSAPRVQGTFEEIMRAKTKELGHNKAGAWALSSEGRAVLGSARKGN